MLNVTEIPYFDGDFWPNVVEETIKELDQEAKEREASEQASVEVCVCVWRVPLGRCVGGCLGESVWGVPLGRCVGGCLGESVWGVPLGSV